MSVDQEVARVLRLCGGPSADILSVGETYEEWLSQFELCNAQLNLSDREQVPISKWQTPLTDYDGNAQLPTDALVRHVSYRDITSTDERDWRDLPVVEHGDITERAQKDSRAIAFYGLPIRYVVPFDPTEFEFRIWYSAPLSVPIITADSGLPQVFRGYREGLTAESLVVRCGYDSERESSLMGVIQSQLTRWTPLWRSYVNRVPDRRALRRGSIRRRHRADPYWYEV